MTRRYYLIRNTSGFVYWSYKLDLSDIAEADPTERRAIAKYGTIYVNRNGGWFDDGCVEEILETMRACQFPNDSIEVEA